MSCILSILSDRKAIFHALSHPLRQKVVSLLYEESRTYTYLLDTLNVESGHLAYHLRHMGDVVEKNDDGLYQLTKLGVEAYRFMEHERPPDEEKPLSPQGVLVYGIALVLIIILSTSIIIFTNKSVDPTTLYLDESMNLIDRSLDTVYEIFDQRYIDRSTWTDMTITLIKLQDRLEKLESSSGETISEVTMLIPYIEAFTDVMSTPDSGFPEATLENRPLIREYHFILIQLKPRLEKMG